MTTIKTKDLLARIEAGAQARRDNIDPTYQLGSHTTDLTTAKAPACWREGSSIEFKQFLPGVWSFYATAGDWHEYDQGFRSRAEAYAAAVRALEAYSRGTE